MSETSPIRLSQCMIVKNEEKNIERALSWGKEFLWEQIVVDTGSTDRTVELAEKLGAKVFHFQWVDDFSAAKNYAIEQATGNWIAFLDADEYFPQEDAAKLLEVLKRIHGDEEKGIVRIKMLNLSETGEILGAFSHGRVFRNIPELRYRNKIHEALVNISGKNIGWHDAQDELLIIHTGYGNEDTSAEKISRNEMMLKKAIEENPKDALQYMYLGDVYITKKDWEHAKECYGKVLDDDTLGNLNRVVIGRSGVQLLTILIDEWKETAEKECMAILSNMRCRGLDPHPDFDYLEGIIHMKTNRIADAARCFESALKKLEEYKEENLVIMLNHLDLVNWMIALDAVQQNDLSKAVQHTITSLRINKYSPDAVAILLKAFYVEWQQMKEIGPYWQIFCSIYDTSNLKDMLFLYKNAKELGFQEIAEQALYALPQEAREMLTS